MILGVSHFKSVLGNTTATFINGDVEAAESHAHGVHLPERAVAVPEDLREKYGLFFVGRSIHSVESALRAKAENVNYVLAGTIFPSQSHLGVPGQGVGFLRKVCRAVAPLPVIAIGGITPERVAECIAAGAAGVAVLSPIMQADDPRSVARAYRQELDNA